MGGTSWDGQRQAGPKAIPARWRTSSSTGAAYDIAFAGGMWTARRKDGCGGTLAGPLPEGLRLRIQADYAVMPVPRDLP